MMGENSKIEWTDHTFNPWVGCTKVSTGCKNCYAETLMTKYPNWSDTWGPQGKRKKTSEDYWKKPLRWNRIAGMTGYRPKVFCGSLCDVFERKDDQPELDDWRTDLFELIYSTPNIDWLLLTKRPELAYWWSGCENVWLGTSVENQGQADKRIPELLKKHGMAVRFLSCEPLLGPVDLVLALGGEDGTGWGGYGIRPAIDWVIVGGESGPKRRSMDLGWARSIRNQCQAAGVPFFMKQIDKVKPIPPDLMIREFPVFNEVTHDQTLPKQVREAIARTARTGAANGDAKTV